MFEAAPAPSGLSLRVSAFEAVRGMLEDEPQTTSIVLNRRAPNVRDHATGHQDVALTILAQAGARGTATLYVTVGAPLREGQNCEMPIGDSNTIANMMEWAVEDNHATTVDMTHRVFTGGVFYVRTVPSVFVVMHGERRRVLSNPALPPITWSSGAGTWTWDFVGDSAAGVPRSGATFVPTLVAGANFQPDHGGGRRLLQAACELPARHSQSSGKMMCWDWTPGGKMLSLTLNVNTGPIGLLQPPTGKSVCSAFNLMPPSAPRISSCFLVQQVVVAQASILALLICFGSAC